MKPPATDRLKKKYQNKLIDAMNDDEKEAIKEAGSLLSNYFGNGWTVWSPLSNYLNNRWTVWSAVLCLMA